MKKLIYLTVLCAAIPAFSHAQERIDANTQKVDIFLTGIKIPARLDSILSNHLYMIDSNGDSAINNLVTVFQPVKVEPELVQKYEIRWHIRGGIKSIVAILPIDTLHTIIFQNGVTSQKGYYELILPNDRPVKGEIIQEAYTIKYVSDDDETIVTPIDPYILIKPPQP